MGNFLYQLTVFLVCFYLTAECHGELIAFTFEKRPGQFVERQQESATFHNVDLKVIEQYGSMAEINKLSAMKDYIENVKNESNKIVLFVESGSLFLNSSGEIISKFKSTNSGIFISASKTCFPDEKLRDSYPEVKEVEKRFLNADGMIGYVNTFHKALTEDSLKTVTDLQYFFTQIFINPKLREKFQVKIDSRSEIFQNVDGLFNEIRIENSNSGEGFLQNLLTDTTPMIVQPNGHKEFFNSISNYLGKTWDPVRGCQHCSINKLTIDVSRSNEVPNVTIAIFIERPTPFLSEFFERISQLNYPKSKVVMMISNTVPTHEGKVKEFIAKSKPFYKDLVYLDSINKKSFLDRRLAAIKSCLQPHCDFLVIVDSVVQLTKKDAIQTLISYNRPILAPLLSRREQLWSNFWGSLGPDGYYSRSFDYLDLVNGDKKGIWNVPHINCMYAIKSEILPLLYDIYSPLEQYLSSELDMIFSGNLRKNDIFMFVVNEENFGYMVDGENTTIEHLHNDLWEIFANPLDWHEKYIHVNYSSVAREEVKLIDIEQPCPDVFWWPFVNDKFATHLIEEMEFFGNWSEGKNTDPRLEGGYENVPTRDIHMRQIKWEEHWMQVLKLYVYPMQIKLFNGYYDEPKARMNFVVRYKPTEQDRLRPHHDAASYTLNLALNRPGIDYEGGGARFLRYKCAIIQSRVGWVLMHPGRVTHIHEGLPTTKGTRYIFVTFVNP